MFQRPGLGHKDLASILLVWLPIESNGTKWKRLGIEFRTSSSSHQWSSSARHSLRLSENGVMSMSVIFSSLNSWLQHIPEVYHRKYFSLVRNFITVNHKSVVFEYAPLVGSL